VTTERIDIVVREDGSRVVRRNLEGIGDSAESAASSLDTMRNILLGLASGAVITGLIRMADTYTNIQNKLRLVTTGTENLARVTKELQGIANSTRSDFEATSELYARLASSSKELGVGQQQLLKFTKTLNQAIVLSGASAEEAAGGLRQLSQGLAAGTLRGDELNSVMENFPKVADIIAQGLGVTRGELRKLGAEGKITARDIIDAFAQAEKAVGEEFAKTVPTVSQSMTVLRNNFVTWIGELDQATGLTQSLSRFIIFLSQNMNTLIPIVIGLGVAIATAFAPGIIQAFAMQVRGLWALMLANPFVALAAVIAGVTSAIYLMRDEIKLGIDDTTTLGDLGRAAWEGISEAASDAWGAVSTFFTNSTQASDEASVHIIKNGEDTYKGQESWWLKLLRVVVQVFDMIGGTIRGVMAGVASVIAGVISGAINSFKQLGVAAGAALEGDWDGVLDAVKSSKAGLELGLNIGENFSKAFKEQIMAQDESGLESVLDGWIARAQEIGKDRAKGAAEGALAGAGAPPKPPVDPKDAEKAARALAQLRSALEGVLDAANPVEAAQRRLAEAQDVLARATAKGLISSEKAAEAYANLKELMAEQLDPLKAVNDELDRHAATLKMSSEQAEIEQQVVQYTQQLRRDGVKLTEAETDALRAKLIAEQNLTRIAQIRDGLEADSQARKQRDLSEKITTAGSLVGSGDITKGDAVKSLAGDIPGLDQTSDFLAQQQEQYAAYYAAIDEMRQNDLISETGAWQAKSALFQEQYAAQFQAASDALTNLSSLQKSENKKQAAIGKAAAIAQTVINTYRAATGAYAAMASIPYVGPFLGVAAAGAAVAAGLANVQAIKSQNVGFRTGGSWMVGGSGGPDSQNVSFRATPGERISVNTPAQARALERADEKSNKREPKVFNSNVTIVQQGTPNRRTSSQQARDVRKLQQAEFERN
jgi:tape measure domain-containing protein